MLKDYSQQYSTIFFIQQQLNYFKNIIITIITIATHTLH